MTRLPFGSERATAREPSGAAAGALPSTATHRSEHFHGQARDTPTLCAHMEARQPSHGIRHHSSTSRALGGGRARAGRAGSCQHRRGPSLGPLGCMAVCSMCIKARDFMPGCDTHQSHCEEMKPLSQPQHQIEEQQPPGQGHVAGQHGFVLPCQGARASNLRRPATSARDRHGA